MAGMQRCPDGWEAALERRASPRCDWSARAAEQPALVVPPDLCSREAAVQAALERWAARPGPVPQAPGADEAIKTMARTISHELNQPLTVLLGLLELWERDYFVAERAPALRAELTDVVRELAVRIHAFTRAERFVTHELAGDCLLDLPRSQAPTPWH